MGKKKPSKSPPKSPKHEKKANLNKIIRPKVFITESSNFKNLVQQLTGNGNSPVSSPAPPIRIPFNQDQEDMSFDSSPLDDCLDPDLSSQFIDLESLLMGIGSVSNNCCVDMMQQEVCVYDYDYDISSFI